MITRIRHLVRILARLNEHRRAGLITGAQQLALYGHVLAEYGRD